MSRKVWIRLGASVLIAAGLLRCVTSFIPEYAKGATAVYFLVDILLLISTAVLYGFRHRPRRIVAHVGLLLMLIALALLIARDLSMLPMNAYTAGALVFAVGLDLFAIDSLQTRQFSRWIPILWILSTIVGPVGYFLQGLQILFLLAGLTFGVAFAAAGVEMLKVETISNSSPNI